MELKFNADRYTSQGKGKFLVDQAIDLARDYITGRNTNNEYKSRNANFSEAIIEYASDTLYDKSMVNLKNKMEFASVLDENEQFGYALFSVVKKAIERLNSKVELNSASSFIEFLSMKDGDSFNEREVSETLVEFKTTGYSNNSQLATYRFDDNRTMKPEKKEAKVAMDVYQMSAYGFDWGRFIGDIVLGQRVSIQREAITSLFEASNLASTPLSVPFAKDVYIDYNEKLSAFNNRAMTAYSTRGGWSKVADTLDQKYFYNTTAGEEILRTGIITNIYDVNSVVMDNAVSRDGKFDLAVKGDKIVMLPSGIKPVKCLIEGATKIISDDGTTNSIGLKTYAVQTSWKCKVDFVGAGAIFTL